MSRDLESTHHQLWNNSLGVTTLVFFHSVTNNPTSLNSRDKRQELESDNSRIDVAQQLFPAAKVYEEPNGLTVRP